MPPNRHYLYKVGWCKVCDQGWLVIAKEIASAKFWIICDECSTLYITPREMIDGIPPQQPHKVGGYCESPGIEEITTIGWDSYVFKDIKEWELRDSPTY